MPGEHGPVPPAKPPRTGDCFTRRQGSPSAVNQQRPWSLVPTPQVDEEAAKKVKAQR